jgi:hypothetical protein
MASTGYGGGVRLPLTGVTGLASLSISLTQKARGAEQSIQSTC